MGSGQGGGRKPFFPHAPQKGSCFKGWGPRVLQVTNHRCFCVRIAGRHPCGGRHFWTFACKSVKSHRDGTRWGRHPGNCHRFWSLLAVAIRVRVVSRVLVACHVFVSCLCVVLRHVLSACHILMLHPKVFMLFLSCSCRVFVSRPRVASYLCVTSSCLQVVVVFVSRPRLVLLSCLRVEPSLPKSVTCVSFGFVAPIRF